MDSYGVLVSPAVKKLLRTTPSFMGGNLTAWSETPARGREEGNFMLARFYDLIHYGFLWFL
jgi:hypothetical protein